MPDLEVGVERYFAFYDDERLHQSLNDAVPSEVHQSMVTLVCGDGTLTYSAPFVFQHMGSLEFASPRVRGVFSVRDRCG